jgi:hypothetical protein
LIPGPDGRLLPAVRSWLVWNEPNNPLFLSPQYRKVGGKWVIQSAVDYAKMCNAVAVAVHGTAGGTGKVACGVTGPRGNNDPGGDRPSVSPLAFLRAMAAAGAKGFDAYAQHPYYGTPKETPSTSPPAIGGAKPTAVTLGNFNALVQELTRLYGAKMRIWITEYGYQTDPPDSQFGVTWANQAKYMKTSYTLARANPSIDMFIWFLLRDEPNLNGWQSGVMDAAGKKKPSYATFRSLPR